MVVCRRKEYKGESEEQSVETDGDSSQKEKDVPGSLNITDEMKRMLNQLWVIIALEGILWWFLCVLVNKLFFSGCKTAFSYFNSSKFKS